MTGRYYTGDKVSDVRCPFCHGPLPVALVEAGMTVHPMCDPEARDVPRP